MNPFIVQDLSLQGLIFLSELLLVLSKRDAIFPDGGYPNDNALSSLNEVDHQKYQILLGCCTV